MLKRLLQDNYLRPHKSAVYKMHPDIVKGTLKLRKGEKLQKRATVYVSVSFYQQNLIHFLKR